MVQSFQSLGYVCHSCRKALGTRTQFAQDATRSFTSSRSLSKTLATFTPTSSPELDILFNTWRKEVFLPSIISPHHQDLVYKTSKSELLTVPPGVSVTVQTALPPSAPNASGVGEETIKLEPMNRFDRQNFTKSFNQITQQLYKTPDPQAWDNLIPFLEGLRFARVEPSAHFLPRLARIASSSEVARWNTILTAATMTKRTGVTLSHQALTKELVLGTFQRAVESKFSQSEPEKTFRRIVSLLDAPEHCGGKLPQNKRNVIFTDMRGDKTVLAVQLVFVAARAIRESSAKDMDGSVASCVQKLIALDNFKKGSLSASVQESPSATSPNGEGWRHNIYLTELMPVYAALALAKKVDLEKTLGKGKSVKALAAIQNLLKDLQSKIATAKTNLEKAQKDENKTHKPRGLLLLDNLEASLKDL